MFHLHRRLREKVAETPEHVEKHIRSLFCYVETFFDLQGHFAAVGDARDDNSYTLVLFYYVCLYEKHMLHMFLFRTNSL